MSESSDSTGHVRKILAWLDEVERPYKAMELRRARARQRLEGSSEGRLHFGLIGFRSEVDCFDFFETSPDNPTCRLQRVEEPPNSMELASALSRPGLHLVLGRYSGAMTYELAISERFGQPDSAVSVARKGTIMNLGYFIISLLKIRTLVELVTPAVSNRSWSTISAFTDRSCEVTLLEDSPHVEVYDPSRSVTLADLQWVSEKAESFVRLSHSEQFQLATEALATYYRHDNKRMAVATLWSGIEALFPISHELRFRLSAYIATCLEPRGPSRLGLYEKIQKLYDTRSSIVHGDRVKPAKIDSNIIEARQILSQLLVSFIEDENVPNKQELDRRLFE